MASPWQPMRAPTAGSSNIPLPGVRGRYVLLLQRHIKKEDPLPRYVHFSWQITETKTGRTEAYRLRDFIRDVERQEGPDLSIQEIWDSAIERIPANGDLRVPVTDYAFWAEKLQSLTEQYHARPKKTN